MDSRATLTLLKPYYIELDINGITTMQAAWDNFFSDETLEVSWVEGAPKEQVTKSKRLEKLDKLTNDTLVISLKRFNADLTKNDSAINDVLDFKIRQAQTDLASDKTYKLVGFIHHEGGCGGGHYTAYIKEGTKWICYNDSNVSEVSGAQAEAAANKAYVFFYQSK